jgi:hypothetical protein
MRSVVRWSLLAPVPLLGPGSVRSQATTPGPPGLSVRAQRAAQAVSGRLPVSTAGFCPKRVPEAGGSRSRHSPARLVVDGPGVGWLGSNRSTRRNN